MKKATKATAGLGMSNTHTIPFNIDKPSAVLPKYMADFRAAGIKKRTDFEDIINDFFDDFDHHCYMRGQPGIGKTYFVKKQAAKRNIGFIHFEGKVSRWAFTKQIAADLYDAGWPASNDVPGVHFEIDDLPEMVVYCDDMGSLFEPDFIDLLKIALEEVEGDHLEYKVSLGGQYHSAEDFEKEAIDHFRVDKQTGFDIPFYGKVKFIFTMNHKLASDDDVEKAISLNKSSRMQTQLELEAALRNRIQYSDIHMTREEMWGWIADLLLDDKIVPGASVQDCNKILNWLFHCWAKLPEKNLRMVLQKMWKPMSKTKKDKGFNYISRWKRLLKAGA